MRRPTANESDLHRLLLKIISIEETCRSDCDCDGSNGSKRKVKLSNVGDHLYFTSSNLKVGNLLKLVQSGIIM